ncbi:MAG: PhoU domain-containing protein [Dysgonamonadaceae bacterium]|jgi:phosphate transport system protein|nr:PhoU domain-containing protein [Dysgonamonadaceae bacterium]MDD3309417.1 PhoU domain-containing protein [Dysgonamonadaceae bacterium]MDD3901093.1 PhoU domain-containing protein [Dysgonamonadaceae bacterium]MDD4399301.1 PhoU domain-containing protein [Dysgonamonadaceae bacterium]MEA5080637.1 PhoU domain-containing protein [Dysgonamonadaceae bacterium]
MESNGNLFVSNIKNRYLDELQDDFQILAEIVLSQLEQLKLLINNTDDENVHKLLSRNEKLIDSLDLSIKEKVINAIILFTPKAVDLRKIMTYYDMTISMERVGDLINNIAKSIKKTDFTIEGFSEFAKYLEKMQEYASEMLKSAVFSFNGENYEMAYQTILKDNKIDKWDKKIEKHIAEAFQDKTLSNQMLLNIMHINVISYYIERIADKAVDISSAAIYLIEGKDVRHDPSLSKKHKGDTDSSETEQTPE